ncbi:MAG: hypothetical protein WBG86_23270 [Polyangiales bacterium]
MKFQNFFLIAIFVAFTGYTGMVILEHGLTGFIDIAEAGGWATQVFIDLCVALTAFIVWMLGDAKARGIAAWPYALAILTTGSVGALAYLVHRSFREPAQLPQPHPATA